MDKGKILVIDDEEVMCSLLKDTLTQKGYKVITTQKPKEGLRLAEKNYFDLIISDLKMPEMDGLDLVREIKQLDADNMVIIITAYPSFETVHRALREGAYDYLIKPFNLEEIYFTVQRGIEFRQLKLAHKELTERLARENVDLEKKVEERTKDLKKLYQNMEQAYMATVKALAQAIDAKDHYTHKHSEKVTKYALAIAKELRLSTKEIETLRQACQLHDLGKIGIHDYILNKPGKLTKSEWGEIKKHSVRAAEILQPLDFLNEAIELIRQHHERYDGTGYPFGIKGEAIKFGARIIAVADSFDAMTSERPYRKAYSKAYTISVLKKNRGTQYDPKVVKAFLSALKKNPKIS